MKTVDKLATLMRLQFPDLDYQREQIPESVRFAIGFLCDEIETLRMALRIQSLPREVKALPRAHGASLTDAAPPVPHTPLYDLHREDPTPESPDLDEPITRVDHRPPEARHVKRPLLHMCSVCGLRPVPEQFGTCAYCRHGDAQ